MTKISNESIYGNEDPISENDFMIGTDGDSIAKKTKTFKFGEIRDFVNAGLEPVLGGTLAITNYNYSGVLTTPEAVINQLSPNKTIMPYEVFVVDVNGNKYINKLQNRIVGDTRPPTLASDYIPIYTVPNGSETKITAGANITATGNGTTATPYVISLTTTALAPLEKINEGSGNGTIIRGRDPLNFGAIGSSAVDLSTNLAPSSTHGATGQFAFAANKSNTASGYAAATFGFDNISSGQGSFTAGNTNIASQVNTIALGNVNQATRDNAIALGNTTTASGLNAITAGTGIFARSWGEISIGTYGTDYIPTSVLDWIATDRIFNVGNGTSDSTRTNALTILKNGLASLPTVTNALITAATGKAIVTKEYLTSVLPTPPDGSETKIINGTNTTVVGNGTIATPYQINVPTPPTSLQTVTISLGTVAVHTGYTIATGIAPGRTLISVTPYFKCTVSVNSFLPGDIVTAQTPSASDGGGLADSGISVKYKTTVPEQITVTTNAAFDINTNYTGTVGTSGVIAQPTRYNNWNNWTIDLVIIYV